MNNVRLTVLYYSKYLHFLNVRVFTPSGLSLRLAISRLTKYSFELYSSILKGATIVSGFGFTGFSSSGTPLWDGAANTNLLEVEIPTNLKRLLDFWNMKTNVWLRECVYKRVTPNGKKPGFRSSMIAFFTSALWVFKI